MLDILQPVQSELRLVELRMRKEFALKEGRLNELLPLHLKNPWDRLFLPAMVLLHNKLFAPIKEKTVAMACVFQFIYLATLTHRQIETNPAMVVLVGDYLYTKFFSYLCRHEALEYLDPLSRSICQIQEAGIWRQQQRSVQTDSDNLDIIDKERALLVSQACGCGAELGGAGEEQIQMSRGFGLHIGRMWALSEAEPGPRTGVERAEALKCLYRLPGGEARETLERLLLHLDSFAETVSVVG
ncbi:MAG: hypothetical protein D9V47_05200 [Clostridia bacterium]|nr:MAG: hypothetical protein D9V47_05200 [Clostridia bacterium]